MNEILLNVISVVVTAVIIPLISYLGYKLSSWLSSKIKSENASKSLQKATIIVENAVKSTFQTYVESLKSSGSFNEDAQKIALLKARSIVESELTSELKQWINENYGDLTDWVTTQIEATIYKLKN